MFSHFAKADEADKMPTRVQFEKVYVYKNELLKKEYKFRYAISATAPEL
ncbi:MAG: hypothetical protein L6V93_04375 [Clostridiales bacterium]|nr:MAG: hypothetical protein L6V93_04375 [Clostridiales bacterium]